MDAATTNQNSKKILKHSFFFLVGESCVRDAKLIFLLHRSHTETIILLRTKNYEGSKHKKTRQSEANTVCTVMQLPQGARESSRDDTGAVDTI